MTFTERMIGSPEATAPPPVPPLRSSGRVGAERIIALVLLLVALLLPPNALAEALAGHGAAAIHLAQLVMGVELLKVALVLHAAMLAVAPSLQLVRDDALPLAPRASVAAAGPWTRAEVAVAGIILVLGTALRIPSLGRGLWFDEIQTLVEYVRHPLVQIISTFDSQNQHLLYSVLARISIVLFGDTVWALRLPAVCFGVASIGALIWFGARVTSRREALIAALILAVSYHHVWFSQNARGYTGLLFFTLVGSGCFLLLLADPGHHTWRRVIGYAVSMTLANMIHVTAVFVALAHALVWIGLVARHRDDLASRAWRAPLAGLALAGTLSFLVYALVLPQLLGTLLIPPDPSSATVWTNPLWMLSESLRVMSAGLPGGLAAVGVAVAVIVAGAVSYWRRSPVAIAVMLLPAIGTGVAVMALSHNFWPRFFFFSAGFAVLIAVRGGFALVSAVAPRRYAVSAATAGAALLAAVSLITVSAAWQPKQDFDAARAYVESNRGPSDAVAATDMAGYVYNRYYRPPWVVVTSADDLAGLEVGHPRTWVIITFPVRLQIGHPALWKRLRESYRTAARYPGTVGGGELYVMVSR